MGPSACLCRSPGGNGSCSCIALRLLKRHQPLCWRQLNRWTGVGLTRTPWKRAPRTSSSACQIAPDIRLIIFSFQVPLIGISPANQRPATVLYCRHPSRRDGGMQLNVKKALLRARSSNCPSGQETPGYRWATPRMHSTLVALIPLALRPSLVSISSALPPSSLSGPYISLVLSGWPYHQGQRVPIIISSIAGHSFAPPLVPS